MGFYKLAMATEPLQEDPIIEGFLESNESIDQDFIQKNSSFELMKWRIFQKDELPKLEVYSTEKEFLENEANDDVFRMREHDTNYIAIGKPDTKVQFSFKFKFFKHTNVYLGYTQIMFWDLFRKESNPFTEINFSPEFYYRLSTENFFKDIDFGIAHLSNGKNGAESRSMDSVFLRAMTFTKFKFGIPRLQILLRYIDNEDPTNKDIKDYYGPVVIKAYFDKLGQKIFNTEELYFEFYNGGRYADDFSRSSVRVSARFKLFTSIYAPKIFFQYFNGFGENLANYNVREETYRAGFSIGGF